MKITVVQPSQIPQSWYGQILGLDIETSDKDIYSDICLVSIYNPKMKESYVIPILVQNNGYTQMIENIELNILKNFLSTIRVVGHNLQFDLSMIAYSWGVYVKPYMDTFILARALQLPEQALKPLVIRLFPKFTGVLNEFGQVISGKPPFSYDITDSKTVNYSGMDSALPFFIIDYYKEKIQKLMKVLKIEMNFLEVAIRIRAEGLNVNLDRYETVRDFISNKFSDDFARMQDFVGYKFRLNSNADMIDVVYNKLNLIPTDRTPKGVPSASSASIKRLHDSCSDEGTREILAELLKLKHDSSVLSSMSKFPNFVIENKIHPYIEQIGFDGTSRVYSKDPSVNQYPSELRVCVHADEKTKFVFFDWSAAEFFIAAYWAKETQVIQWFKDGVDVHAEISKLLLNKATVTPEERKVSKVVTFASIFGSEGAAVANALNISSDEGVELVRKYGVLFPKISALRNRIIEKAVDTTYTHTIFGRPRRLPLIKSNSYSDVEHAKRQAFNTAIQGSCADFFKICAHKVFNYSDRGVKFKFGVFDSLLLQVPDSMGDAEIQTIVSELCDFTDIAPGLKFNFKYAVGYDWGEVSDKL